MTKRIFSLFRAKGRVCNGAAAAAPEKEQPASFAAAPPKRRRWMPLFSRRRRQATTYDDLCIDSVQDREGWEWWSQASTVETIATYDDWSDMDGPNAGWTYDTAGLTVYVEDEDWIDRLSWDGLVSCCNCNEETAR